MHLARPTPQQPPRHTFRQGVCRWVVDVGAFVGLGRNSRFASSSHGSESRSGTCRFLYLGLAFPTGYYMQWNNQISNEITLLWDLSDSCSCLWHFAVANQCSAAAFLACQGRSRANRMSESLPGMDRPRTSKDASRAETPGTVQHSHEKED